MGKRVKIILSQDVINIGEEGDICEVASGYARNYLIPKKLAKTLNKHNLTILNQQKSAIEKRREEKRLQAQGLKERLEQEALHFTMQSGENGKLFGSITNGHIAEELQKKGYAIEKKMIDVPDHHLKQVGDYNITIKLYGSQEASIKVKVEGAETEDKAKAEKKAKGKKPETVNDISEAVTKDDEQVLSNSEGNAEEESLPADESLQKSSDESV